MRTTAAIALASALAAPLAPLPARAAENQTPIEGVFATLQRLSAIYNILIVRMFVDVTYDTITVSPDGLSVSISGARVFPDLEWDQNGNCVIDIDRLSSDSVISFETLVTQIDVSGVSVPSACFDPGLGGMMQGFGYDGLTAQTMSVEIGYDLPSAGADIAVQAALEEAGDLSISADFDYLWFKIDPDGGGDPEPVARLREAEIAFENGGLWERLEPMAKAQVGDLNAVPQMAQLMLGQLLTEGGSRTPTEQENALVQNVADELARFLEEKNRLVVTVAPDGGLWLDPDAFDSPPAAIAALNPVVSATPVAYRSLIEPGVLSTALSGGGTLSDADRLTVGRALLTGVGAPRSIAAGQALLQPLADGWNSEAAELIAEALKETGEASGAYAMALRAMTAGSSSAIGIADALELELSLTEILSAQGAAAAAWPEAGAAQTEGEVLIQNGDVPAMRKLAFAASTGKGRPRDYGAAYFWASLAAAGGDRGAANLRNRLDKRFTGQDAAAWKTLAATQAGEALRIWTDGGLGAAIYQRAQ